MEKINIAELLKDCPRGMELYSPIFGEVYLDKIRPHLGIVVTTDKEQGDFKEEFLYDGRYGMKGECMLFPSKGKTTWEGFVPPCQFKDGDILYIRTSRQWICIYKEGGEKENVYYKYAATTSSGLVHDDIPLCQREYVREIRLASEKEKQQLFDAIKENGYKWNAENKTLEKLFEPTISDTLLGALNTFGPSHQRKMCIEECAELIDALAKYDRGRAEAKDVITELADVSIMVEQMAMLYGEEEFKAEKERKLKRLQKKIDEASNL